MSEEKFRTIDVGLAIHLKRQGFNYDLEERPTDPSSKRAFIFPLEAREEAGKYLLTKEEVLNRLFDRWK